MEELAEKVKTIANSFSKTSVALGFLNRVEEGFLTRDENSSSHFCVYFAAYNSREKQVFIGHHKKSGLWLFNGGHIDKGETPEEALTREMGEGWGVEISLQKIGEPKLITITLINNPKIKCVSHYDIWFFVPVSKTQFFPDKVKLDTEFYQTEWKSIREAKKLITDPANLKAISEFEKIFI